MQLIGRLRARWTGKVYKDVRKNVLSSSKWKRMLETERGGSRFLVRLSISLGSKWQRQKRVSTEELGVIARGNLYFLLISIDYTQFYHDVSSV